MKTSVFLPLFAGLSLALPQATGDCVTVTSEIIVPTTTATYVQTATTWITESGAKDGGTFTDVVRVSSTSTLETITSTSTVCTATGTITNSVSTATVYTTAGAYKRAAADAVLNKRQDACTVTTFFTTTYGQTETLTTESSTTSTVTFYTAYTEESITKTSYGYTAYTIATAVATTSALCGSVTVNTTSPSSTTTITQDARCAPSALVSAYNPTSTADPAGGYGLEYSDSVPIGGATYYTNATDASQCCQLCAEANSCAASTWDINTEKCELAFPVEFDGGLNCGEGFLVYYDAGPDSPMAPGTGLYVGTLCGNVAYGNAAPDDGT